MTKRIYAYSEAWKRSDLSLRFNVALIALKLKSPVTTYYDGWHGTGLRIGFVYALNKLKVKSKLEPIPTPWHETVFNIKLSKINKAKNKP